MSLFIDKYDIYYLSKKWKDGKKQKNFSCEGHVGSDTGKDIKKILPLAEQFADTHNEYGGRIKLTIEIFEE
tara:strand:+ start:128 stop:340 length:213 start_codon:yes stop_codon:yes gene_type:complete